MPPPLATSDAAWIAFWQFIATTVVMPCVLAYIAMLAKRGIVKAVEASAAKTSEETKVAAVKAAIATESVRIELKDNTEKTVEAKREIEARLEESTAKSEAQLASIAETAGEVKHLVNGSTSRQLMREAALARRVADLTIDLPSGPKDAIAADMAEKMLSDHDCRIEDTKPNTGSTLGP